MFRQIFCFFFFTVSINANDWVTFVGEIVAGIQNSESYIFPTNNDAFFGDDDNSTDIEDYGTFDFIIVGGGTAGGVLATRLTEENFTVLVIEAGSERPSWSAIFGLSPYLLTSEWNWGYKSTANNISCLGSVNQQCYYPRGKVLGGGSVFNAGLYVRGNKADFDKWEELGNDGWSYEDVLPYFKKGESAQFDDSIETDYHGYSGPQTNSYIDDTPGLTQPILQAFEELGLTQGDYNGQNQTRCSKLQYTINKNSRSSIASDYIDPVRNRTNLEISLESLVTKVIICNRTATGVHFIKNGTWYSAQASKEVIVSAGTINTPQVLMLSGVGPAGHLEDLGIDVIADLPVGQYFQDHIHFPGLFLRTNQTFYKYNLAEYLELWRQNDRPLTGSFNLETVAYFEPLSTGQPGIEVLSLAAKPAFAQAFKLNAEYTEALLKINDSSDIAFTIALMQPSSYGNITLQSSDPRDFPNINANTFSNETDLELMYNGIQDVLKIYNTTTFQDYGFEQLIIPMPGCDGTYEQLSKDWWYCALRHLSVTLYHPIGTTRMGNDSCTSVVDSNLKVHGIDQLRVIDAGVMPAHVSGHTNVVTVMIAEKAADMIKALYAYEPFLCTPVSQSATYFYKHIENLHICAIPGLPHFTFS